MTRQCPILRERVECSEDCEACRWAWTERAAIAEYLGNETRARAEDIASEMVRRGMRGQRELA